MDFRVDFIAREWSEKAELEHIEFNPFSEIDCILNILHGFTWNTNHKESAGSYLCIFRVLEIYYSLIQFDTFFQEIKGFLGCCFNAEGNFMAPGFFHQLQNWRSKVVYTGKTRPGEFEVFFYQELTDFFQSGS